MKAAHSRDESGLLSAFVQLSNSNNQGFGSAEDCNSNHYLAKAITTDTIVRFIAAAGEHFLSFRRIFLYHRLINERKNGVCVL